MLQLNAILLASAILAFCESAAIIEKLNKKCSLSDNQCLQDLHRGFLQEVSDYGIPELGIPKTDPLVIENREIVALGMVKITVKKGEAKGFKGCYSTNYKSDLTTQRLAIDLVCDAFSFEGSYKLESTPALMGLIGGIDIHGEGNAGITAENVHLSVDFAFEVKKFDDGELHLQIKPDDSSYDFEIKGKTTYSVDNIFVGKQDISSVVVNILNENSGFIVKTFGRTIVDMGLAVFYEHTQKFLSTFPANILFTDDLSSYVKS